MNANLYRDPRWQKLRLEKLNEADWKCEECGDSVSELHVHHRKYRGDAAGPWDYQMPDLQVLCSDCHRLTHVDEYLDRSLTRVSFASTQASERIAIRWLKLIQERLASWWGIRDGLEIDQARSRVAEVLARIAHHDIQSIEPLEPRDQSIPSFEPLDYSVPIQFRQKSAEVMLDWLDRRIRRLKGSDEDEELPSRTKPRPPEWAVIASRHDAVKCWAAGVRPGFKERPRIQPFPDGET